MTVRVFAAAGSPAALTLNGRSYSLAPGTVLDMVDTDGWAANSNGWLAVGAPRITDPAQVGTTAQRSVRQANGLPIPAGTLYIDTTLSVVAMWDGAAWRNVLTGAAV